MDDRPDPPSLPTFPTPAGASTLKVQRLAVATATATYLLLIIGGLVNPTGSSLACPDWPLCYGEVMPPMEGGILFEHSHRLAATAVGLMTCVLAVSTWWSRRADRAACRLAWLAVGVVVFQGVLGGVTVLLRLPTLVSTLHLATSLAFLLLLIYLCFRLAAGAPGERPPEPAAAIPRGLPLAAVLAVYGQAVLGGLVRHVGAGRACGDDPLLCGGVLWPELGAARLHVVHRWAAVLVLGIVLAAAHVAFRRALADGRRLAAFAALSAPVAALAQAALGVVTVLSNVAVVPVVAHTGGAALLLACTHLAYLGLGPLAIRSSEPGWDRVPAGGMEVSS